MEEKVIKSVVPIYAIGILWFLYSIFFSMYTLRDMIIATLVSLVGYIVACKIFPGKTIMVEVKQKPADTGNELANQYINQGYEKLGAIRQIEIKLEKTKIVNQIQELETTLNKILEFISKYPDKARQLRTFMDYYLPTTIKLLENYDHLNSQGLKGENIAESLTKIENVMVTMVEAFKKQLDSLFEDKTLDIAAEVNVLNDILKREGLADNQIPTPAKESDKVGDIQ